MGKKKKPRPRSAQDLRLNPEERLCAKFDELSIAKYPIASRDDMGMRVRDNCAEENIK